MIRKFHFATFAVAAGLLCGGPAEAQTLITGTLTDDRYLNPNSPGGTSQLAPLFAFFKDESTTFFFNTHYATYPMKWSLTIPAELQGQNLSVTSASIVLWQRAGAGSWDPAAADIKMFATGVTGTNGFTAATWNENQAYIGPSAGSATPLQDPYLVELGTNARAEDNINATPWALGQVDASYNGSSIPTQAVPITFQFDVSNAQIKTKLEDDMEAGFALWSAASTYYSAQPPAPASDYPRIVTKEGATNATYGPGHQAPLLMVEVVPTSSVSDWQMY